MYQIIENCYPYFVRFTHPGIEDIANYCNSCVPNIEDFIHPFTHYPLPLVHAAKVNQLTPTSAELFYVINRMSLFITKPGYKYRAHKDGVDHKFSINYPIRVLDEECVTSWYSDEDLASYSIDRMESKRFPRGVSRECVGFDKSKHTPLKTMVARPGECILFNTNIFHDWDNSKSNNYRIILTLRHIDAGNTTFDDAMSLLFEL